MRQIAQRPGGGDISVVDVPAPALRPGWVLVANRFSLISAGTERTKVVTGEKNLVQKARARPDLVKKVVDKARVEGVRAAVGAARDRLSALAPIGYSSAGLVVEVGEGVDGLAPATGLPAVVAVGPITQRPSRFPRISSYRFRPESGWMTRRMRPSVPSHSTASARLTRA